MQWKMEAETQYFGFKFRVFSVSLRGNKVIFIKLFGIFVFRTSFHNTSSSLLIVSCNTFHLRFHWAQVSQVWSNIQTTEKNALFINYTVQFIKYESFISNITRTCLILLIPACIPMIKVYSFTYNLQTIRICTMIQPLLVQSANLLYYHHCMWYYC